MAHPKSLLARPFSMIRFAAGAVTTPYLPQRQARFSRLVTCMKYLAGFTSKFTGGLPRM